MRRSAKPLEAVDLASIEIIPPARRRGVWGNWRLDRRHAVLEHKPTGYLISLEWCLGNAALLDWAFQLGAKRWLSDCDFRNLVRAFDEIFAPQSGMCSFGCDRPSASEHARRRLEEWRVRLPRRKAASE